MVPKRRLDTRIATDQPELLTEVEAWIGDFHLNLDRIGGFSAELASELQRLVRKATDDG
jgi:hypothetical protein